MKSHLLACALLLAPVSVHAQVAAVPVPPAPSAPSLPPSIAPLSVPPSTVDSVAQPLTGPTLWRDITGGMSVTSLRAMYSAGPNVTYKEDRTILSDVPIMEGCKAKVNVMHPTGTVKEIVMRGEGAIAGRCSLKIITALSGKYGEPLEKDKVRGSLFAREGKNYVWSRDGVTLQFKRYTNGPLGGGGLLAASWEMRYSANAANIDL